MGRGSFFDSTLRGLAQSFSGQSARSARSQHRGKRIQKHAGGQVHAPNTEESMTARCGAWRSRFRDNRQEAHAPDTGGNVSQKHAWGQAHAPNTEESICFREGRKWFGSSHSLFPCISWGIRGCA